MKTYASKRNEWFVIFEETCLFHKGAEYGLMIYPKENVVGRASYTTGYMEDLKDEPGWLKFMSSETIPDIELTDIKTYAELENFIFEMLEYDYCYELVNLTSKAFRNDPLVIY